MNSSCLAVAMLTPSVLAMVFPAMRFVSCVNGGPAHFWLRVWRTICEDGDARSDEDRRQPHQGWTQCEAFLPHDQASLRELGGNCSAKDGSEKKETG